VISAILLAAGSSKRYGKKNKLLEKYKSEILIKSTLDNLLKSRVNEIIIILGHDFKNVSYNIKKSFKIKIVYNKNFSRGMSSSIILGLKNINKKSKGVLVCLSDMPKIKMSTYNTIVDYFNKNPKLPAVPYFKSRRGNPVCFPQNFISSLKKLKGDKGARHILKKKEFNKVRIRSSSILFDLNIVSDFKK